MSPIRSPKFDCMVKPLVLAQNEQVIRLNVLSATIAIACRLVAHMDRKAMQVFYGH